MKLKNLFTNDRAVSPVIGVILMVAITVILAAVIGTFVIGLGDDLGGSSPSASFGVDVSDDQNNVTFTHNGGDRIPAGESRVTSSTSDLNISEVIPSDSDNIVNESLTAGSTVEVQLDNELEEGQEGTIRLIFESGDRSATLSSATVESGE